MSSNRSSLRHFTDLFLPVWVLLVSSFMWVLFHRKQNKNILIYHEIRDFIRKLHGLLIELPSDNISSVGAPSSSDSQPILFPEFLVMNLSRRVMAAVVLYLPATHQLSGFITIPTKFDQGLPKYWCYHSIAVLAMVPGFCGQFTVIWFMIQRFMTLQVGTTIFWNKVLFGGALNSLKGYAFLYYCLCCLGGSFMRFQF